MTDIKNKSVNETYVEFSNGLKITSASSIDERILLTKAQMLELSPTTGSYMLPDIYFCICRDDGCLYIYDANGTKSETTGYYKKYETGGSTGGVTSLNDLTGAVTIDIIEEDGIKYLHITNTATNADETKIALTPVITKEQVEAIPTEATKENPVVTEDDLDTQLANKQDVLTAIGDGTEFNFTKIKKGDNVTFTKSGNDTLIIGASGGTGIAGVSSFAGLTGDITATGKDGILTLDNGQTNTKADINLLDSDQLAAVNSGITEAKVGQITTNEEKIAEEANRAATRENEIEGKIPTKTSQLTNDGDGTDKFATAKDLTGKQDSLSIAQLAAVNSGITEAKVGQITTNESNISKMSTQVETNTTNISKNSDEISANKTNIEKNAAAITDETTRAKAAEEANAKAISEETTRATGVEANKLDKTDVSNEGLESPTDTQVYGAKFMNEQMTNITTQFTTMGEAIAAEASRATSEEGRLEGLITEETTARTTADDDLQANIEAEADTRAKDIASEATIRKSRDDYFDTAIKAIAYGKQYLLSNPRELVRDTSGNYYTLTKNGTEEESYTLNKIEYSKAWSASEEKLRRDGATLGAVTTVNKFWKIINTDTTNWDKNTKSLSYRYIDPESGEEGELITLTQDQIIKYYDADDVSFTSPIAELITREDDVTAESIFTVESLIETTGTVTSPIYHLLYVTEGKTEVSGYSEGTTYVAACTYQDIINANITAQPEDIPYITDKTPFDDNYGPKNILRWLKWEVGNWDEYTTLDSTITEDFINGTETYEETIAAIDALLANIPVSQVEVGVDTEGTYAHTYLWGYWTNRHAYSNMGKENNSVFTNSRAGLILGTSSANGYVEASAASNGTLPGIGYGHVAGWEYTLDEAKTQVLNDKLHLLSTSEYNKAKIFAVDENDAEIEDTNRLELIGNAATATKWQTARTFKIQDSSGTNTGDASSVNGTADVTLKLPSIIKANITGNLTGNADTATSATNATNDEKGNNIAGIYATKAALSVTNTDLNVIQAEDCKFSGNKTFNDKSGETNTITINTTNFTVSSGTTFSGATAFGGAATFTGGVEINTAALTVSSDATFSSTTTLSGTTNIGTGKSTVTIGTTNSECAVTIGAGSGAVTIGNVNNTTTLSSKTGDVTVDQLLSRLTAIETLLTADGYSILLVPNGSSNKQEETPVKDIPVDEAPVQAVVK